MRSLEKSNRHFRDAVTKLPLGVASNFRYWGDDKTIYIKSGKGGRRKVHVLNLRFSVRICRATRSQTFSHI